MNSSIYQYYVEGEDEKRIIEVLKTDMQLIKPGKVQVLNVVQERISDMKLRVLSEGTTLIFVFDADAGNPEILSENIAKALGAANVKEVHCITQVKNLEDEIVRSTNIKKIEELFNSKNKGEFKKDLLRKRNVKQYLEAHSFDLSKFWSLDPPKPYEKITNEAEMVKLL